MLRKYIQLNPKKFSTNTEKLEDALHLYYQDQQGEYRLNFMDCLEKTKDLFSIVPNNFRAIPYVDSAFFKLKWSNYSIISRDENSLDKIDEHLKAIQNTSDEEGLALFLPQQD